MGAAIEEIVGDLAAQEVLMVAVDAFGGECSDDLGEG
jgi:hypothetical protein